MEAADAPARDADDPATFDRPMDPWLFIGVAALTCLGVVMVYSAGIYTAQVKYSSWDFFLEKQGAFAAMGLAVMLLVARIDYRILRRYSKQLMLVALAGLVAVLFLGTEVNGARRWLRFGISIQPSEIAKIALAVFLSATLARQGERVRRFRDGFLPVIGVASLTMVLVLAEKDLGTTILLGGVTLTALFVAGTRIAYVVAAVMLAAPLVWHQIIGVGYRRSRFLDFLSGEHSYQIDQSLITIGSGGEWGVGLGAGRQKLGFLPENHTDFIFASIGEELGFAGLAAVLTLYALIVWRGVKAAQEAPDRFGAYLALCLATLFGFQALINMAVVLDIIPAKGITLPFLSYGGSSLLVSMGAVGILLSISRRPTPWKISDMRAQRPSRQERVAKRTKVARGGTRPNSRRAAPA
ncbi:MAG: putative lipid II flippase FtsW [Nannocystaceae bacterium]